MLRELTRDEVSFVTGADLGCGGDIAAGELGGAIAGALAGPGGIALGMLGGAITGALVGCDFGIGASANSGDSAPSGNDGGVGGPAW